MLEANRLLRRPRPLQHWQTELFANQVETAYTQLAIQERVDIETENRVRRENFSILWLENISVVCKNSADMRAAAQILLQLFWDIQYRAEFFNKKQI